MNTKLKALTDKYFDFSMLRWGAVGLLTSGIDYFLFITLYGPIKSVFITNLISSAASTSINYFTHHLWTFKSNQAISKSGFRYFFNLLFWWVISTSLIKIFIFMGLDPKISKIIPILIISPINFFILSKLVFKNK